MPLATASPIWAKLQEQPAFFCFVDVFHSTTRNIHVRRIHDNFCVVNMKLNLTSFPKFRIKYNTHTHKSKDVQDLRIFMQPSLGHVYRMWITQLCRLMMETMARMLNMTNTIWYRENITIWGVLLVWMNFQLTLRYRSIERNCSKHAGRWIAAAVSRSSISIMVQLACFSSEFLCPKKSKLINAVTSHFLRHFLLWIVPSNCIWPASFPPNKENSKSFLRDIKCISLENLFGTHFCCKLLSLSMPPITAVQCQAHFNHILGRSRGARGPHALLGAWNSEIYILKPYLAFISKTKRMIIKLRDVNSCFVFWKKERWVFAAGSFWKAQVDGSLNVYGWAMGKDSDYGASNSESWDGSDISDSEDDLPQQDVAAFISAFSECKRFSEARSI